MQLLKESVLSEKDKFKAVNCQEIWNKAWLLAMFNSTINDTSENKFETRTLRLPNCGIEIEALFQKYPSVQRHLIIKTIDNEHQIEINDAEIKGNIRYSYDTPYVFKILKLYEIFHRNFRDIKMIEKKLLREVEELNYRIKDTKI